MINCFESLKWTANMVSTRSFHIFSLYVISLSIFNWICEYKLSPLEAHRIISFCMRLTKARGQQPITFILRFPFYATHVWDEATASSSLSRVMFHNAAIVRRSVQLNRLKRKLSYKLCFALNTSRCCGWWFERDLPILLLFFFSLNKFNIFATK